jgi:phage I-like protein
VNRDLVALFEAASKRGGGEFAVSREAIALRAAAPAAEGAEPAVADAPPTEIQVFVEGQWVTHPSGEFELNAKTFDEMIKNFRAAGVDPCVDREHESMWMSTDGARGWVKSLRVGAAPGDASKKALFAGVEWTEEGEDDVRKKRFRYVSGAFFRNAQDRRTGKPIGAVLDSVGMCKKPFIQGMEPLTNSATAVGGAGKENPMSKSMERLITILGARTDATADVVIELMANKEEQLTAAFGDQPARLLSEPARQALGLKADAKGADVNAAIVALAEKVAKQQREGIAAKVDAAIAAFKATPAEKDDLVQLGGTNPELLERLLSKRDPRPPASQVQTPVSPSGETRLKAQNDAIATWLTAHPGETPAAAVVALTKDKPELFGGELEFGGSKKGA